MAPQGESCVSGSRHSRAVLGLGTGHEACRLSSARMLLLPIARLQCLNPLTAPSFLVQGSAFPPSRRAAFLGCCLWPWGDVGRSTWPLVQRFVEHYRDRGITPRPPAQDDISTDRLPSYLLLPRRPF